jgi:cytochrome c peroxidase
MDLSVKCCENILNSLNCPSLTIKYKALCDCEPRLARVSVGFNFDKSDSDLRDMMKANFGRRWTAHHLFVGFLGTVVLCGSLAVVSADSEEKRGQGRLTLSEIANFLTQDGVHDSFYPAAPLGFSQDAVTKGVPEDNPLTRAKVELGRQLYFDKRLSANNTINCATCHQPSLGYGDGRRTSMGIGHHRGGRNAPTVINRLFSKAQFWDGRAASLEEQALGPIANPIEMGNTLQNACQTIEDIAGYRLQFLAVFGSAKVTPKHLAMALAAFERTVLSGASPYDLHERAEPYRKLDLDDEDLEPEIRARAIKYMAASRANPMSASALRGQKLFFNKAKCSTCHTGANFTDELYYNIGVGMASKKPDKGRSVVTGKDKDTGAFKTPGLRNIADSGPYMHDGKTKTLADVVELYNKGGEPNKWLSERITTLNLTKQEKADLVSFMKSLSGHVTAITAPKLP